VSHEKSLSPALFFIVDLKLPAKGFSKGAFTRTTKKSWFLKHYIIGSGFHFSGSSTVLH